MAFIPIESHQHPGPLVTTTPHHNMHQFQGTSEPSTVFTNDTVSEYPIGSVTEVQQQSNDCYNPSNGTGSVVRNIKIQIEEDESETESENKIQESESENGERVTKEQDSEEVSSETNTISLNETLLSTSQPNLGQGRKAVLLDLWALNEISLQIRNWLVKSGFDVTPIIGNYQVGVSCGYIAAQAACIFRKLFNKEIEDEPIRPLIFSQCLDPDLIKTANNVLGIDDQVALSLDMVQIYEVILSLMGGSDDLGWLTVTTWNAFLEGMTEGHSSTDFSVWIINTADTESSLQESYDDRGDHWFTVVLWP
ncbi:unnamed protein product [Meganyctiphanes norvegica]|uniref:Uncharacterized protein n=1 Tax=Meganyctiphanes norvegica TaxID=48144 RepID=A0AAV2RS41_MEGNR